MTAGQDGARGRYGCCVDRDHRAKTGRGSAGCSAETCMKLPEGKTCGDCVHAQRCRAFGFTSSLTNDHCDFFPRRFQPAEPDPNQGAPPA